MAVARSLRFDIVAVDKTQAALQSVSRGLTGVSRRLDSLSQSAGLNRLSLGLGALGALAVKTASDVEEMTSKFNVVFRDSAEEVRAWSRELSESLGRSAFDLQAFAAQVQDTFVPLGFARDQATEMSKVVTQLAVDLASFNNVAEPETIDLLTSALVGNHEAVRRFGVIITQATLSQELLNLGVEGGVSAASEQQKVLARLGIILRSTSDAQGDAARTSDEFANRVRALRGELRDSLVLIGQEIMPTLADLSGHVSDAASWFGSLEQETRANLVAFGGLVATLGPAIAVFGALTAAVIALATPIGAIVVGLTALTGAVIVFREEIANAFDGLKIFFSALASWASSGIAKILPGKLGEDLALWAEGMREFALALANVSAAAETASDRTGDLNARMGWVAETTQSLVIPAMENLTATTLASNQAQTAHVDLLNREAERIRAAVVTTGERIDKELQLVEVLEASGRISDDVASKRRLGLFMELEAQERLSAGAEVSGQRIGQAYLRGFDTAERALLNFARTGEANLLDLLQTALGVASDIARAFDGGGGGFGGGGGLISSLFSLGGAFSGGGGGGGIGLGGAFSIPFGLQHGGRMVVPGGGGPDNQLVGFRASPGEEILVNKAGRHQGGPTTVVQFHNDFTGAEAGVEETARRVMRQEVQQMRGVIVQDSLAAVEAENNAGGRFARASGRR